MPIIVEICDAQVTEDSFAKVFDYFRSIDDKFSTYKETSEISKINKNLLSKNDYSDDMKTVMTLSEETKKATGGYFDIYKNGYCDPSGLVKGWAIYNAAELLKKEGLNNFFVDAGGDIQVSGQNCQGKSWIVGIRNPFTKAEIIKILFPKGTGVATSGTYIRGQHIYNPHMNNEPADEILSLTVIGPNIYEADRFATAAFAMGRKGISFIENLAGFEGYMIDKNGMATLTSGFMEYSHS